ncbi:MAG: HAD family hydrolase [Candidatus Nanohaloarchaea archaeon]
MAYSSVIFDMDGVLLNSLKEDEKWKFDAVGQALEQKNIDPDEVPREEMKAVLGDKGYRACLKKSAELGVDPREMWSIVARETSAAREKELENGSFELYPGVEETLRTLREEKVSMAVISNAPETAVKLMIEHFNLKQFFDFYAGVRNFEDLRARKPHPNHLELAKAELKRNPFVYVGDGESDLEAAENAEIDSIWVDRGNTVQTQLDHKVDSINELTKYI